MSAIVGVIIGLVLAYSLSAIVVSQVNELIRTFLKSRSTFLVKHLNRMIAGVFTADDLGQYVQTLLRHPLINSITTDASGKIEVVRQTTSIDPAHLTTAIEQTLNDPNLPPELQKIIVQLTGNLAANPTVQEIQHAIEQVKGTGGLLRDWVDKQFDRMTKVYKRNIFISTFLLGLLVSVVLNIDTIQMTQFLWKDPTLREAVVQTAGQVAAQSAQAAAQTSFEAQDATDPNATPEPVMTEEEIQTAVTGSQVAINNLLEANLPITWISTEDGLADPVFEDGRDPRVFDDVRNHPDMILWKIVGILFSAAAISLGSDFWFNLLRNLAGRR